MQCSRYLRYLRCRRWATALQAAVAAKNSADKKVKGDVAGVKVMVNAGYVDLYVVRTVLQQGAVQLCTRSKLADALVG